MGLLSIAFSQDGCMLWYLIGKSGAEALPYVPLTERLACFECLSELSPNYSHKYP